MVTSMLMIGCGSKDGGGAPAPGAGLVSPYGPVSGTCATNQVNTAYGCLYIQSCGNGYGWLPGEARCVPAIATPGGTVTSGNYMASLSITSPQTFALFLQNMGQCEPVPVNVWYAGYASCDSYTQAGYVILQMPSITTGAALPPSAMVVIGAGASTYGAPNSNWTTGGKILSPAFNTTLAGANSDAGFTGVGPYGFRFVVNSGRPGNSYQMFVELQYNGQTFATGNLIRR